MHPVLRWIAAALVAASCAAHGAVIEVEAGPIWANADANNKCPQVCSDRGAQRWTGEWRTTQPGRMSVCGCDFAGPGPLPSRGAPPQGQPWRPAAIPSGNACSVGGSAKCPGCSVSCESGLRPVCRQAVEGVTSFCARDASCSCEK